MPITSKQRAYLRGLAMNAETIKGKVLESSMLTAREACDELCERCTAEPVQCIGTKFVLYKRNEKEPKIELPKAAKKK